MTTLLSACTTPHLKPIPRPGEDRLIPPSTMLTMDDGARIPLRIWNTPHPRAIILALHGFSDSRDAWEWPAPAFNAAGITIIAPDLRGFGASPRAGHWSSTQRMLADAKAEAVFAQAQNPHLPLYVMGESMGGALALLLAASPDGPRLAGAILVSPAILTPDAPSRGLVDLTDWLAPQHVFTGAAMPHPVLVTDNLLALRRMYFDPLTQHTTRMEALAGLMHLMMAADHAKSATHVPTLILYGDRDQLVPAPAIVKLWHGLPDARRDMLPGGHHALLRDRKAATQDIIAWMFSPQNPLPSSGDIAASAWLQSAPLQ